MPVSTQITTKLARQLVDSYGDEAAEAANEWAEALTLIGNREAAQIWSDVSDVLHKMRTTRA